MSASVFDASAILAVAFAEPGSDAAMARLPDAVMSSVNFSEAAAKLSDKGMAVDEALAWLEGFGIEVAPFGRVEAVSAARLRATTRHRNVSFADRACLSLALARGLPAVTTDKAWSGLGLACEIVQLR